MATPLIELANVYFTPSHVQKELKLSRFQLDLRIARGVLPKPTFTDKNNVRYFSDGWLAAAKMTLQQNNDHGHKNAEPKEKEG